MRLHSECEVNVRGRRPERALNLCAENGITVRGASSISETELKLRIDADYIKTLSKICDRAGLDIELLSEAGVGIAVRKFKRRYVLWAAPLLMMLAISYLSLFIWEIEVTGNNKVSTEEILSTLDEYGFSVGTFSLNIDASMLSNEMLTKIKDLSFMAINIHGSKVDVIVREKIKAPERITNFEPPKPVFKQYSASMPLNYTSKRYTGEEYTKNSIIIGKFRINFYFTSGNYYGSCDIIEESKRLDFLGYSFPISFNTTRYRPWVAEHGSFSVYEATEILKSQLSLTPENVINESYTAGLTDGLVTVKRSVEIYE